MLQVGDGPGAQFAESIQQDAGRAVQIVAAGQVVGDGGHTGLSSNGWLTLRAGDTVNGLYAVARIRVGVTSNPCPADVNGDNAVNASDLAAVLAGWGGASPDLNGDGIVNASDLATILAAWGPCN